MGVTLLVLLFLFLTFSDLQRLFGEAERARPECSARAQRQLRLMGRAVMHATLGDGESADALSADRVLSRGESRTLQGRDVLTPSATDML